MNAQICMLISHVLEKLAPGELVIRHGSMTQVDNVSLE
jgi:hypothetical protein